ncbi:MAG: STAS domain-containing protein [Actinobacteria bacterium]|nr:STAS domain-containing protein [Actinomycetota bacterium]
MAALEVIVSTAPEFAICETRAAGQVVVAVCGELDADTAPQLQRALQGLAGHDADRKLVVDVGGLTFIDSSGVYVLVQAVKRLHADGRSLSLSGANPGAFRVLDVCGVTSVFDLS